MAAVFRCVFASSSSCKRQSQFSRIGNVTVRRWMKIQASPDTLDDKEYFIFYFKFYKSIQFINIFVSFISKKMFFRIDEDEVMQRTNQAPFSVRRTGSDNIPCYVTLRQNRPVTIL